jgi:hypothetical protein
MTELKAGQVLGPKLFDSLSPPFAQSQARMQPNGHSQSDKVGKVVDKSAHVSLGSLVARPLVMKRASMFAHDFMGFRNEATSKPVPI